MKALWMKVSVLGLLVLVLLCLLIVKLVVSNKEDWVVIEEKYFPEGVGEGSVGINSGEKLDMNKSDSSCAMKFDNGHTYKVNCDEYLDFTVGEEVKIVILKKNTVKLRRK
ncbi:hypothetical protein JI667_12820 [Bacillus sp. NTK074B]|uniref:hypothetical protein n=1 Tax=Bacillus sp. NTK074B TaxID=2802174 RepID=UPI001A8CBA4F|nr:hypothetical protein [Bacillus sp. NTK074B]